MKRSAIEHFMALAMSLSLSSQVFAVGASGLSTQLVGARALGQGNAFVADASDPSALYYNPAGITQLSATNLSIGSTLLTPIVKRTEGAVTEDKMNTQLSALPMFYLTHTLDHVADHRIAFGVQSVTRQQNLHFNS
jgi:long-subunit fatty acid transport protein